MQERTHGLRRPAAVEALTSLPARRVLGVLTFALLTAVGARAAVPLPGTAVPVTLQTLFVLLSGALLGARLGAASQAVYLLAGIAGLPVFAAGSGLAYLFGPTGGYLLSYPVAAAAAGQLARRADGAKGSGGDVARLLRLVLALFLASCVVFAGGAAQLTVLTGDFGRALRLGVLPFVMGDLVKVVLAAVVVHRLRRRTLGLL